METLQDVVTQLRSPQAGGFDFRVEQAELLAQEGVKLLAAKSQWLRTFLELGPTVADQAAYPIPSKVVRLYNVALEKGPYERKDIRDLDAIDTGRASLTGPGGIFAETFGEDGVTKLLELRPVPDIAGQSLRGLASIVPDDLALDAELPFPHQYRRAVLDFAIGVAYEQLDENPQAADRYLGRAEARAEQLFALTNARTGQGPVKFPVAGHTRR